MNSTKQIIKSKALPLFSRKGYEGTTMNEIAELVGIKKASLYAHYRGKEELFFAIYEDLQQDYISLTQRIMNQCQDSSAEGKLRQMFEQYVGYYTENPDIQAFWIQGLFFTPSDIYSRFYAEIKEYQAVVEKWIEEAIAEGMRSGIIPNGDPAKLLFAYLTFREGLLNGIIFQPEMNGEENIGTMWLYFWLGVKGRS